MEYSLADFYMKMSEMTSSNLEIYVTPKSRKTQIKLEKHLKDNKMSAY